MQTFATRSKFERVANVAAVPGLLGVFETRPHSVTTCYPSGHCVVFAIG